MYEILNVLLLEDEVLIANDFKEIIEEAGNMHVYLARYYQEALEILSTHQIQICLLDINLNGGKSGIDLATYVNVNYKIPIIYITSYSDSATIESAKHTFPSSFLVKPVGKSQIMACIDIALFSSAQIELKNQKTIMPEIEEPIESAVNDYFFIKDNSINTKINFDDILFIESKRNYVTLKTLNKQYTIRFSLKKVFELLPKENFIQCSNQYIVNLKHIDSFSNSNIKIKGHQITISRNKKSDLFKRLKL